MLWAVDARPLDDDGVRREVNAPRERRRADKHLDAALHEKLLNGAALEGGHAGVVDRKAVGDQILQLLAQL